MNSNIAEKIPEGYKKTEIGVIPEDWKVKYIHDIVRKFIDYRGVTPKKLNMVWGNGNILALSANNVQMGYIDYKKECYFASEKLYKRWMRNGDCAQGDILLTMEAPLGNVAFIPDKKKYILSQRTILIRPIEIIEKDFLRFFMMSEYFQKSLFNNASGSTAQGIQRRKLEKIKVYFPQYKAEQAAIARVLSDMDALIESLEKLIAKKKAIKQGAMQQLLTGKKRLPGFSEGWKISTLGELCNYQNGTTLEKYFNNKDGLKVISIGNYSESGKFVETNTYIDRKYSKELREFILNKNNLTMILNDKTSVGTIIGRVLIIEKDGKYIFNQRTMRLSVKDKINPLFLYFKINSNKTHRNIVDLSKPGTQIYVNTDDIVNLKIEHPRDKSEQTAIAKVLSDIDAEIEKLEQKRDKYISLKQGMMQQLLTGKIRLVKNGDN